MMNFKRDEIEEGIPDILGEFEEAYELELDFSDNISGITYLFEKYCDEISEQSWESLSETVFIC